MIFNYDIPENCTHVKLDVGLSYNAPQSQIWLSIEPNLMVFGFEPNTDVIDSISNGKKNILMKKDFPWFLLH